MDDRMVDQALHSEETSFELSLSAKDTTISIDEIIKALRNIEHVSKVELISMSM